MHSSVKGAAAAAILSVCGLAMAQNTGPSTSTSPYVLPSISGVTTTSIFTTGDTIGGYRMVGIPDGLGMFANGGNSYTVMMNHELGAGSGIARSHGQNGAFVSRWTIDSSLHVLAGRDHNTSPSDAYEWTGAAWSNAPSPDQQWNRFCSADMAPTSAFQFTEGGTTYGTSERIYLNGEEPGNEGRAYAHIASGPEMNTTWRLPSFGRASIENTLANPFSQRKTVVMIDDDSTPGTTAHGSVLMYVGNKQTTGNTIEKAGLTNGNLYSLRVQGFQNESRSSVPPPSRFDFYSHGDARNQTGAQIDSDGFNNGAANFLRPEDGSWDPRPGFQNNYYFVTTDSALPTGRSRLWRMTYDDISNPLAGGTITNLLNGTEGGNMFDNMCIEQHGRILLQEDLGNASPLGKIWMYDIASGGFGQIAAHDPSRFLTGGANFLTQDEESSGIIDASSMLGDGWFMFDVQAHNGIPGELVEGGQLLAMYVPINIVPAPGAAVLLGIGGMVCTRRRRA